MPPTHCRGDRSDIGLLPYGRQRVDLPLTTAANQSKEMISARRTNAGENLRLLYVGMTRARDYLILAGQQTTRGTDWLKMVVDEQNQPVFSLPLEQGPKPILNMREDIIAQMSIIGTAADLCAVLDDQDLYETTLRLPGCPDISYSCSPSAFAGSMGTQGQIKCKHFLGQRIQFSARANVELIGNAIHRFLAADVWEAVLSDRIKMAQRIIRNWGITESMSPADFVEISDRLKHMIDKLYPDAIWHRECPVSGRLDAQRMKGSIDLLLEVEDSYIIIDHKTFPGRFEPGKAERSVTFPSWPPTSIWLNKAAKWFRDYTYTCQSLARCCNCSRLPKTEVIQAEKRDSHEICQLRSGN